MVVSDSTYAAPEVLAPLGLVAPVWGERHSMRFLDVVLPSWMEPGNIPALAARRRLTIVVLTRAADIPLLQADPLFQRLCGAASTAMVSLDDLIATPRSTFVTLTLAFQRGLWRAAQEGAGEAILLNADFVLARNALGTLTDVLGQGAGCILAPSLRAVEQEVTGALRQAKSATGTISLSSRELVSLAFSAPHPTALCSRVDQNVVHSLGPHQFYWRPDQNTMIGRALCLFPLAVRLGDEIGPAQAFVDYGLLPLLTPGVRPVVMSDSDAFFVLELASLEQELRFFTLGAPTPAKMAECVAGWSTQFHRDQAITPIFYRAGEPGHEVPAAVERSARYMSELLRRLPAPQPIRNHPHWLAAVALWRIDRQERGLDHEPPELADAPEAAIASARDAVRKTARTLLVGRPGRTAVLHPRWALARPVSRRMARDRKNGPVLLLGRSALAPFVWSADEAFSASAELAAVWLAVDPRHANVLETTLKHARSAFSRSQSATVLVLCEGDEQVAPKDLAPLLSFLDAEMDLRAVKIFDLRLDEKVRSVHGRLADQFAAAGWPRRLTMIAASAGALVLMTTVNIGRWLPRRRNAPSHVSAVLVEAVRRNRQVDDSKVLVSQPRSAFADAIVPSARGADEERRRAFNLSAACVFPFENSCTRE